MEKNMSQPANRSILKIMNSLNWVQSRNLIFNQFNFKGWNREKKYQSKKLARAKKITIKKMKIKFDRKKTQGGWN
jgi:hypothetical protein